MCSGMAIECGSAAGREVVVEVRGGIWKGTGVVDVSSCSVSLGWLSSRLVLVLLG